MLRSLRNENLALPLTVGFVRSDKLYYGQYLYKVRVPNASPWHNQQLFNLDRGLWGSWRKLPSPVQWPPSPEANKIRNMLGKCDIWLKENNLVNKQDYKVRKEVTVNFFFNDPTVVENFVFEFEEYVIDVWGPVNDDQKILMLGDEKIVIKNKLWHNKFRYKLTFMGTKEFQDHDAPRLANWMLEQDNHDDFYASPNFKRALGLYPEDNKRSGRNYIYNWSLCSLYCSNEEDILMIKLMSSDSLAKIEKCVTYEELESDK